MTQYAPDDVLPGFLSAVAQRWEATQPQLPPVVYHYTSVDGFRGIIRSQRLWATVTSALNDTTELSHAAEALKRTLTRHAAAAHLPEFRALHPPQLQTFDYLRPKMARAFVASLSGSEDDLNQWCMYADRFGGVALGFDAAALRSLDAARDLAQNLGFFAVSYSESEQEDFFDWLVSLWEREAAPALGVGLLRSKRPFLYMAHWFGILATCALAVFPRMKNPCFRSEDEWRVTHLHIKGLEECSVLSNRGKKYVELKLDQLSGSLPLRSVWLGPSIANDASVASTRAFLDTHGFQGVEIRESTLPLRVERKELRLV